MLGFFPITYHLRPSVLFAFMDLKNVCVYCGSSGLRDEAFEHMGDDKMRQVTEEMAKGE